MTDDTGNEIPLTTSHGQPGSGFSRERPRITFEELMTQLTDESRPARWQQITTDAGVHLRMVGANGEIVMHTEPYTEETTAQAALALAARTFREAPGGLIAVEHIDARTQPTGGE